jgi:biopolymer transport protein ExbB/TolQ
MDNKKFAIFSVMFLSAASAVYFTVEAIRLRKATKKLYAAQKSLKDYKSIAQDVIASGDTEEAEIMLTSITRDEKKLEEAKSEKAKTSSRMKTIGKTILNILPSFLQFLGGVASSPIVKKEENVTIIYNDD